MQRINETAVGMSELARVVFSNPPQEPRSICIEMEPQTDNDIPQTDEERSKILYNNLFDFMCTGVKVLFKVNEINFKTVDKDQIKMINKYMNSIGYHVFLTRRWMVIEDVEKENETKSLVSFKVHFDVYSPDSSSVNFKSCGKVSSSNRL